ncbi:MAG: hypothetical protein KKC25_00445 [Proteobacteria bacterium]|nr:hypothetical protein [Pseudomonadota bacterium]MBU2262256.1 hypothetical protein [Pseudomonadota bacterium]
MKPFENTVLLQFKELISSHIGLNIREKDSESFSKVLVARIKSTKYGEPAWLLYPPCCVPYQNSLILHDHRVTCRASPRWQSCRVGGHP